MLGSNGGDMAQSNLFWMAALAADFFELITGVGGVFQAQGANLIRYRAGQQVLPRWRLALDYAHNSHCLLVTFFGDRRHLGTVNSASLP